MDELVLVGIGTGRPEHLTLEGQAALRAARAILLPQKGEEKRALVDLRHRILKASGSTAQVVPFEYPERDPALPYLERVKVWHDEIARRWQVALEGVAGPVALMVWGDPALYDSTMRIAERLSPPPRLRVVPGITAVQALTAAHGIPLNTLGGDVVVTTGRRLRDRGWPTDAETVVVMLDAGTAFAALEPAADLWIWWGAYLGSEDEILLSGPVANIAQEIAARRAEARARHGWIMDTYLLRRTPSG